MSPGQKVVNPRKGEQSIRQKLFAGTLLTTLSALLIFGAALIAYDLRDYYDRTVSDLATQARVVGLSVIPALEFSDRRVAQRSLAVLASHPGIQRAAVYDASGALFATYRGALAPPSSVFPAPEANGERFEGDRLLVFRSIVRDGEFLGTVFIAGQYLFFERLWQYAGIVVAAMLTALVLSMLLSLRMQKQLTRPILGITAVARRVTEQRNYRLRAEKSSNDEVGYLVDAFNDLLSEVEQRSAALETSNSQLHQEIADRRRATDEVRSLNAQLEHRVALRTADLERANGELEAFSYSVSHDLRTPLRAIDGFSQALLEDYEEQLDEVGRDYLHRVRQGAQRMGRLIDDLLKLARVSRAPVNQEQVDLTGIANAVIAELRSIEPGRKVATEVQQGLTASGDPQLLRIALENLLGNAWKYTGKRDHATIQFRTEEKDSESVFCIRDNGAGFDMAYADKLFGAFQRLHESKDYPGTGVGLATVQRIIHRHSGHIWAEAAVDGGASFYFTVWGTLEEGPPISLKAKV